MLTSDPYFDGDKAEADFHRRYWSIARKQKVTFELRYFQDLPYKEISEIIGTSGRGLLKANHHHAVKEDKKILGIEEL